MKSFIRLHYKHFWFEFGWFGGNPFRLFHLNIWETLTDTNDKLDMIEVIHIQLLKLTILDCGWQQ